MEEIWKVYKIIGGNRYCKKRIYEVSNFGNVKINGILVKKLYVHIKGYNTIGCFLVHRAVAELFIPNPNNYSEVDHIDGNKLNNNAENLRWCTHVTNLNNPITKHYISESSKKSHNKSTWKNKQSESQKNKVWMSNGIKSVRSKLEEINKYLELGYHYGRS